MFLSAEVPEKEAASKLYLPGEHVGVVRVRERLLELDQLRVREGGSVPALLPARVVVQSGQGGAAVVLGEVAAVVVLLLLAVVVAAVVERRGYHHCGRLRGATCLIGPG